MSEGQSHSGNRRRVSPSAHVRGYLREQQQPPRHSREESHRVARDESGVVEAARASVSGSDGASGSSGQHASFRGLRKTPEGGPQVRSDEFSSPRRESMVRVVAPNDSAELSQLASAGSLRARRGGGGFPTRLRGAMSSAGEAGTSPSFDASSAPSSTGPSLTMHALAQRQLAHVGDAVSSNEPSERGSSRPSPTHSLLRHVLGQFQDEVCDTPQQRPHPRSPPAANSRLDFDETHADPQVVADLSTLAERIASSLHGRRCTSLEWSAVTRAVKAVGVLTTQQEDALDRLPETATTPPPLPRALSPSAGMEAAASLSGSRRSSLNSNSAQSGFFHRASMNYSVGADAGAVASQRHRGTFQSAQSPLSAAEPPSVAATEVGQQSTATSFRTSTLHDSSGASRHAVMSAFVPRIAAASFQLTEHDEPVCRPVSVTAAIMFVDISGYSQATRQLERQGAFALFESVNSYFDRIIDVCDTYGGEVVKFAGDALTVLWYGAEVPLQQSVCAATRCALALQQTCGEHSSPHLSDPLRIHIGIGAGPVTSSVFRSSDVTHMEGHYHLLEGRPLEGLGEVLDSAAPGEVCIDATALAHVAECGSTFRTVPKATAAGLAIARVDESSGTCCCTSRRSDAPSGAGIRGDGFGVALGDDVELDEERRKENVSRFIHPSVRELIKKGSLQAEMAKMRLLTVLFIHKTDSGTDVSDWFVEVQHAVDEFRAAVVQVLRDDKGLVAIAAVNLHSPDREPAVTGIRIAKSLLARRTGCTVGVACGNTFCGVVGNSLASRFDITGATCVRACRLMQYGVRHGHPIVIGENVVDHAGDLSLADPIGQVLLKGTPEPTAIYRPAPIDTRILSSITSANRFSHDIHRALFAKLRREVVEGAPQRQAALIRGCNGTGKAFLSIMVVHRTAPRVIPLTHIAVENSRPLDLLWTLGEWFAHSHQASISSLADELLSALRQAHRLAATQTALKLVDATLAKGQRHALIVRHCQRLDSMSLSFLRQSLAPTCDPVLPERRGPQGRWIVFVTYVPQHGQQPWSAVSSGLGVHTVVASVGQLTDEEAIKLATHCFGWECSPQLAAELKSFTGNNAEAISRACAWLEPRVSIGADGVVRAESEVVLAMRSMRWDALAGTYCAKLSQVVEALSGSAFSVLRVFATLATPFATLGRGFAAKVAYASVVGAKSLGIEKDIDLLFELRMLEAAVAAPGRDITTAAAALECGEVVDDDDGDDDDDGPSESTGSGGPADGVRFCNTVVPDLLDALTLPAQARCLGEVAVAYFDTYHELATAEEVLQYAVYHELAGRPEARVELFESGLKLLTKQTAERIAPNPATGEACPLGRRRAALGRACAILSACEAWHKRRGLELTIADDVLDDVRGWRAAGSMRFHKELPMAVVQLRDYIPPLSLGFITVGLRKTQLYLRAAVVNAGAGCPESNVDGMRAEAMQAIRLYERFTAQIDELVEFAVSMDEAAFLRGLIAPGADYAELCERAAKYITYVDEVVVKGRVEATHAYLIERMHVPDVPEGIPWWKGWERAGLERALRALCETYRECPVTALRRSLMQLATVGWIPLNPDLSLEFQRDCYLRRRTHSPVCFVSFTWCNLQFSIPDGF